MAHRWPVLFVLLLALSPACVSRGPGPEPLPELEATAEALPTFTPVALPSDFNPPPVPAGCADPQPPFITDFEVRQTPSLAEPPARAPFRDPVFGTCLVRVTDRKADPSADDPSAGMKNEYARVQSFNADGSAFLIRGIQATWYLYDAATLQPIRQLPIEVDPRWDARDPDLLYYNAETRLMCYNVRSGEARLVHDFGADFSGQALAAVWTRYEGSPSVDTRYFGLMAEDQDWQTVAFLVYDRQSDQLVTRNVHDLPAIEEGIDHVTMSTLGTYFIASFDRYCEPGSLGDDAHPCGLMVYDRDLKEGRSLLRIIGHYDIALDVAGREVIIFQDIDQDQISMLDLTGGDVTPLWPIDFSHTSIGLHFSGLAFRQPGWALVSTYDGDPGAYTWMDDQVFAVELKPGGRVVRLAHTHSLVDENQEHDYWAEPHASVNPDFTRILFTSNWGRSGTEEVDAYMIDLPPGWIEELP